LAFLVDFFFAAFFFAAMVLLLFNVDRMYGTSDGCHYALPSVRYSHRTSW
jgi:hypothetical protein